MIDEDTDVDETVMSITERPHAYEMEISARVKGRQSPQEDNISIASEESIDHLAHGIQYIDSMGAIGENIEMSTNCRQSHFALFAETQIYDGIIYQETEELDVDVDEDCRSVIGCNDGIRNRTAGETHGLHNTPPLFLETQMFDGGLSVEKFLVQAGGHLEPPAAKRLKSSVRDTSSLTSEIDLCAPSYDQRVAVEIEQVNDSVCAVDELSASAPSKWVQGSNPSVKTEATLVDEMEEDGIHNVGQVSRIAISTPPSFVVARSSTVLCDAPETLSPQSKAIGASAAADIMRADSSVVTCLLSSARDGHIAANNVEMVKVSNGVDADECSSTGAASFIEVVQGTTAAMKEEGVVIRMDAVKAAYKQSSQNTIECKHVRATDGEKVSLESDAAVLVGKESIVSAEVALGGVVIETEEQSIPSTSRQPAKGGAGGKKRNFSQTEALTAEASVSCIVTQQSTGVDAIGTRSIVSAAGAGGGTSGSGTRRVTRDGGIETGCVDDKTGRRRREKATRSSSAVATAMPKASNSAAAVDVPSLQPQAPRVKSSQRMAIAPQLPDTAATAGIDSDPILLQGGVSEHRAVSSQLSHTPSTSKPSKPSSGLSDAKGSRELSRVSQCLKQGPIEHSRENISSGEHIVRVIFTGVDEELDLVNSIGAQIVSNATEATHIILADELKRTPKLMIAINSGVKYVVRMKWLQDSVRKKAPIPIETMSSKYIVKDHVKETLWRFSLVDTLSKPRDGRLYAGLRFYFTDKVYGNKAPCKDEMLDIIKSGGGEVLDEIPDNVMVSAASSPVKSSSARARSTGTAERLDKSVTTSGNSIIVITSLEYLDTPSFSQPNTKKSSSSSSGGDRADGRAKGKHQQQSSTECTVNGLSEAEASLAKQGPGRGKVYGVEFIFLSILRQVINYEENALIVR